MREPLPKPSLGRSEAKGPHPRAVLLLIGRNRGEPSEQVEELELRLGGVTEDRHATAARLADARTPWHPRGVPIANTRQVSLVSVEECSELAGLLSVPQVDAESLGANLVVVGLPA